MPLFKRKLHSLTEPPHDLRPKELVFQVRFTKEIFRDYQEYLKRINLYRQRVWTCKVTGKSNLTYEDALVSERRAAEKVQHFPKEFMGPVLNMVQFSVIRLDELGNNIYKAFKNRFVVGEEIVGVQGDITTPCRILKVIPPNEGQENSGFQYEVGWLDDAKNVSRTSVEPAQSLIRKKNPFTMTLLKSFIRESAINSSARGALWFVQDKLCNKYAISVDPPEELRHLITSQEQRRGEANGATQKESIVVTENGSQFAQKRRKKDNGKLEVDNRQTKNEEKELEATLEKVKSVQYPIDDLLVEPTVYDPPITKRPIPALGFRLSMDCIGNLLMVWNFCTSFSKTLHLSPFSLEDFERALEYKEGEAALLRETNYALLSAALTDPGTSEIFMQVRQRKAKVSIHTWKDDLCDILELHGIERFKSYLSTIRQGYYRLLEPLAKLDILQELVACALDSTVVRNQLDKCIEEKQAIAAQKRKEGIEMSKEQEGLDLMQTDVVKTTFTETSTRVYPDNSDHDRVPDDENLAIDKNINANGLPLNDDGIANGILFLSENGSLENGNCVPSRQAKLKLKAALKQAEEKEREEKRMEEQKKIQEMRKARAEALRAHKLHAMKMFEFYKRQEQHEREMEKRSIRTSSLGKDRNYNRYWFFQQDGRIFVESEDSCKWGYYSTKEELDAFYGSLDTRGIRENVLKKQLDKHFAKISDALQKRSKNITERTVALEEVYVRRSFRMKSTIQPTDILAYVNKYRNS